MEYIFGFLLTGLAIFSIMLVRSITTIFHEFGHAIPALLFTNKPVNIYIGSYGDTYKTKKFKLGKFTLYFKFNLFDWKIGMCSHEQVQSLRQRIIIIIGGPFASLLIAIPLSIWLLNYSMPDWMYYLTCIFIMGAVIDFFVNIVPYRVNSLYGTEILSDGNQLLITLSLMHSSDDYKKILKLIKEKSFKQAISESEDINANGKLESGIYDLYIHALIEDGQFDLALTKYQEKKAYYKLVESDYFLVGTIYLKLKNYKEALKYFEHCFATNGLDASLLSQMGLCHMELGNHEFALRDLSASISNNPNLLEPYANRGIVYFRLKQYHQAFHNLKFALENDPENGKIHYYLGQCYEDTHALQEAYDHYLKADKLNCQEHGLAYRMEMVRLDLER